MIKMPVLLLIAATLGLCSFAEQTPILFMATLKGKIELLRTGKYNYCIADNTVYEIEKKTLSQKITIQGVFNDAANYNNNIVLATSNGLLVYNTKSNTVAPLLPDAVKGNINHVQTDNSGHIWFTKEYEGCFMIDSSKVIERVKVPVTYDLAYTNNGNIWVGTNVGLYKVPVQDGDIVRYAEEGIASNDLPDNLVEQLFTDAQSNIWIIMPGHISFLTANEAGEMPDYEHIGKENNELYSINAVSGLEKTYLFATSQGVLLLRNTNNSEALFTGEIHQTVNEKAYQLTNNVMEKPNELKTEPIIKITILGDEIYFITCKGFWAVPTSKLAKHIKNELKK